MWTHKQKWETDKDMNKNEKGELQKKKEREREPKASTHQVSQDDFDGQEMARGVQQDASVCKSGEVADDGCIDGFL